MASKYTEKLEDLQQFAEKAFAFAWDNKDNVLNYVIFPYMILCFVVYLTFGKLRSFNRRKISKTLHKKILFIVAHPDDECMFFAPTIQTLIADGHLVELLCLTPGNHYGYGFVRKRELAKSCQVLGLSEEHVFVLEHREIKDHQDLPWRKAVVAEELKTFIYSHQPNCVISFDSYGVSGHKNHISTFTALQSLCDDKELPSIAKVFCLDSVMLPRKYVSFLELPLVFAFSRNIYLSSFGDSMNALKAMRQHHSQMVWFRWLYVLFSRYMLVNTLTEVCHHGDC